MLALFGAATYLAVRIMQRSASRSDRPGPAGGLFGPASGGPQRRGTPPPRPRPVAPDDDPEFLRELDRRHKRAQGDKPGEPPGDAPTDPAG